MEGLHLYLGCRSLHSGVFGQISQKKLQIFHRCIKKLKKIKNYNHAITIVKFSFLRCFTVSFSILYNKIAITICLESFVKIIQK